MFHQMEGLVIDRAIHMGHLKWTLDTFVARFFEAAGVTTRFRPHHFPFTEPSAEMDVQCDRSGGQIRIGTESDWLEVVGCGMVHPKVLANCGLDPDEWQGFAFGFGIDRLAMLKYGMPDLRDMFASDTRWLKHYGFSPYARCRRSPPLTRAQAVQWPLRPPWREVMSCVAARLSAAIWSHSAWVRQSCLIEARAGAGYGLADHLVEAATLLGAALAAGNDRSAVGAWADAAVARPPK